MKQRVQITGKNINDIFRLPCVTSVRKLIRKTKDNDLVVSNGEDHFVVDFAFSPDASLAGMIAYPGDCLIEEDDGSWRLERDTNQLNIE